ncbi:hypothetical protein B0H14DRAFT_2613784 [Mycena olivaceomarginata]|nr:hypothetical protein B0H14DRAFT_2613784 [Mycena olivaceomarginata]
MPTETAATTGPTANNKSSLKPRTGATSKALSPATMAARHQASARYHKKLPLTNLEEEREKVRAQMARLHEKVMQEDNLAEDFHTELNVWQECLSVGALTANHLHEGIRQEAWATRLVRTTQLVRGVAR